MSLLKISLLVAGICLIGINSASAAEIGTPAVAGTGCPAVNSHRAVEFDLDLKKGLLKLEPSEVAVAGDGKTFSRLNCAVALPLQLASDEKLVVSQLSTAAVYFLPAGAKIRTSAEIFLAGSSDEPVVASLEAKKKSRKGTIKAKDKLAIETECGASVNLRINSSVIVQAPINGPAAIGDLQSVLAKVQIKKCK